MILVQSPSVFAFDIIGELQCLQSLKKYNDEVVDPDSVVINGSAKDPWKMDLIYSTSFVPERKNRKSKLEFTVLSNGGVFKCTVPRPTRLTDLYRLQLGKEETVISIQPENHPSHKMQFNRVTTELFAGSFLKFAQDRINSLKPIPCEARPEHVQAKAAIRAVINKSILAIPKSKEYREMIAETERVVRAEEPKDQDWYEDYMQRGERRTMQVPLMPCGPFFDTETMVQLPRNLKFAAGLAKIAHQGGYTPGPDPEAESEPEAEK